MGHSGTEVEFLSAVGLQSHEKGCGILKVYLVLHREDTGLPSLACHPVPLFLCMESQCAACFPWLNEHGCLPEDREGMIKEFVANGVEGKEAKVTKISSYQLQRHLRYWYLGFAMPLQLCTHVRTVLSPR